MNKIGQADTLRDTRPMTPPEEKADANVFIFVDEDIKKPLKSLLVWDGYDRKDVVVTKCLATMNQIRYGYQYWAEKEKFEKKWVKKLWTFCMREK